MTGGGFEQSFWRSAPTLVGSRRKLAPNAVSDEEFRLLAENIPTLCWIANGDGYIVWYNRRWHEYTGTTPEQMEGWGWQSVHDPEVLPAVMERWTQSIATGEPFEMTFPLKGADGVFRPFLTRVQPVRDERGKLVRWFGVNTEIGAQVAATEALRESEARLRVVQKAGRIGSFDYDIGKDEAVCSDEWYGLVGLPPGSPVSLERMRSVVAAEDWPRVTHALQTAIDQREPLSVEYRIVRPDNGESRWLTSSATMILDSQGNPWRYIGGIIDITEQTLAAQAMRDSEERLRAMFENAAVGMIEIDSAWNILRSNEAYRQIAGRSDDDLRGANCLSFTYPDDLAAGEAALRAVTSGEAERVAFEKRYVRPDGSVVWVRSSLSQVSDAAQGNRLLKVVEDITEVRNAREALRAESQSLEILNTTAAKVAAELDLGTVVQTVTDAGVELTGARFGAFFYTVKDDSDGSFLLYALSGAERSQFDDFGHPRPTPVFAPTFRGEGVLRSDDITKDERYGRNPPHKGMPEGHLPVRSYLAVPVTSRSGEVIGGLLFGHPDPGVFDEASERLMIGLAGQAAIAIDNARLYENVQRANQTLEQRVAERTRELEVAHEALRQSQKMEAIGQLTGGIAHDFNNLLAGISGGLELIQRRISQGRSDGIERFIAGAQTSAQRAAALTQRLLAFSRRQTLDAKPTDVNRLVLGMEELIHRTVGPAIKLEVVGAAGLWPAMVDVAQLESALLNLCINARDAMPDGGQIIIETANKWIDARAGDERDLPPGQYISICVSDTGTGIPRDIIDRIFDPFFTTKPIGQGTGLGLSMIHGFVRQSGGQVRVYSEPGQGTTMCLYFPRYRGKPAEEPEHAPAAIHETLAGETVLVIDDEPTVRMLIVEILRETGYHALEAEDGPSGLKILESDQRVDLLITDVGLPGGMNGRQVADAGRVLRPGLKVLFITGFAENAAVAGGHLEPGMAVVTKPFVMAELANTITELIER